MNKRQRLKEIIGKCTCVADEELYDLVATEQSEDYIRRALPLWKSVKYVEVVEKSTGKVVFRAEK